MSFLAEIAQPGDVIYVSNESGNQIRVWFVHEDGTLTEITTKDTEK